MASRIGEYTIRPFTSNNSLYNVSLTILIAISACAANIWEEVVAEEEAEEHQRSVEDSVPTIVYRRQNADVIPQKDIARFSSVFFFFHLLLSDDCFIGRMRSNSTSSTNESRKSIVLVRRVSRNRSLSTRLAP